LIHVVAHLFIMLYYKRLTLFMVSQADLEFLQSVVVCCEASKFIKIKTKFSLEHVINSPLEIRNLHILFSIIVYAEAKDTQLAKG